MAKTRNKRTRRSLNIITLIMKTDKIILSQTTKFTVVYSANIPPKEMDVKLIRVNFAVNETNKIVSAILQPLQKSIVMYSGDSFEIFKNSTEAQLQERLREILGEDVVTSLHAICNNTFTVPAVVVSPAYQAAANAFNSLTLGKQALWEPVRVAVAEAILKNDLAKARQILETVPAIYPGAEDDRATFLSLFD